MKMFEGEQRREIWQSSFKQKKREPGDDEQRVRAKDKDW